jgi:hypothetical protein
MPLSSPLLLLALVYVSLVAASEIGFRVGRWRQSRADEGTRHLEDSVQTASLGLVALLLGFSFALVASRYDSRRQVVVHEANAISTAYFDAELLPEPHRSELQATLRRYVVTRIRAYDLGTEAAADAAIRSKQLQDTLWKRTMAAAGDERVSPIFATAIARSVSEVNDSSEDAMSAFENKLPGSIMRLLFAVAGIATWIAGYCDGMRGRRLLLVLVVQPLLIALVIIVIADMDEPFRGWLHVSKNPLVRTQESME